MGVVVFIIKQPSVLMKIYLTRRRRKCSQARSCFKVLSYYHILLYPKNGHTFLNNPFKNDCGFDYLLFRIQNFVL